MLLQSCFLVFVLKFSRKTNAQINSEIFVVKFAVFKINFLLYFSEKKRNKMKFITILQIKVHFTYFLRKNLL